MKVLLIDLGSTFVKCLVYEPKSEKEVFFGKLPFPQPNKHEGTEFTVATQDIRELVKNISAIGVQYRCERMYISVQMHGFLLRRADGTMSDYISWRDKSGDITCVDEAIDFDARGTSLKANLPFVKLWKQKNQLQGAEFYTLGSYISYLLTGNNITHKTDACASGFYDSQSLEADAINGLRLPTALHDVEMVGTYEGMEVYAPMGDHQVSFLGSGAGEDKYLVNVGTATQVSCLGEFSHSAMNCEQRPYFSRGQRLFTMTGLTGGDKIYQGVGMKELSNELIETIQILPKKQEALFGGGGGRKAYTYLCDQLKKHNIKCSFLEKNIGMEGLKWISKQEPCCRK